MGHPCFVFLVVSGLSMETISHGLCLSLFVDGGGNSAILILEQYAFKTKKMISFTNVISDSYTPKESVKSHN